MSTDYPRFNRKGSPMSFFDYTYYLSPQILLLIQNDWSVPVGMIALYFYGRFHFNTPSYPVVFSINPDERARLITQAPPIFTTRRSRYNSYSMRYILILESA